MKLLFLIRWFYKPLYIATFDIRRESNLLEILVQTWRDGIQFIPFSSTFSTFILIAHKGEQGECTAKETFDSRVV